MAATRLRLAVLVIVAHIAQVAECANLKGSAPPKSEKASMMGAMMEGMIATMKAAGHHEIVIAGQDGGHQKVKAPVQELTVPVAPTVAGEDLSDGNVNDAFSKAMAITEDEDLDLPVVLPVAHHVKAIAVATMPDVATASVQLGMMEKELATEKALNMQLALKVGEEEKTIRVIEKQAVRKIKTLKSEVLGLKARLDAAPAVLAALVAPPAPVAVVAPTAPVAVAALVVPVVAIAAAPVVQVAPAAPPAKSMAALMNLFAKVNTDAFTHAMHTKLKASNAQNHLELVTSASRAQIYHGSPHGFRGIIKHEVAPPHIKFKDLLQLSK